MSEPAPGSGPPPDAEWLEADGLGGYALGTASGRNARRYHGHLVAATLPPARRSVLLAKTEETLVVGGRRVGLSVNRYPGVLYPRGDLLLASFSNEPFPRWSWEVDGLRLAKTLLLVHAEPTCVVTWEVEGEAPEGGARLDVRPLLALRDHHALRRGGDDAAVERLVEPGCVTVTADGGRLRLHLAHDADGVETERYTWWDLEYDRERERGFDFREDLLSPFGLVFDLGRRRRATLVASTVLREAAGAAALRERERARRVRIAGPQSDPPLLRALRRAAERFVVERDDGVTVIAGYPWFTDWGRDTTISLPGLLLATGRHREAKEVLRTFARFVEDGLIPNRFPDRGEPPVYDTVDASLWFVEAVRATWRATGDDSFLGELFGTLTSIVEAHERGTRYGIRVDADGLLAWGAPGVALTWMDARVEGRPVTPRRGKPVEVEALWFNALASLAELAGALGERAREAALRVKAARANRSFTASFWNEAEGCLLDAIGEDGVPDPSIRPNQLLALSLHHPLVAGERAAHVLAAVEAQLLTPFGLRTLAPSDPAYRGRYEGGPAERDGAYHQGTVWPWLIGPYASAHLRVHGDGAAALERLAGRLRPLAAHLLGEGLGQLPELFDGDPPHRALGCPAQAWSVAELLRVLAEKPELVPLLS